MARSKKCFVTIWPFQLPTKMAEESLCQKIKRPSVPGGLVGMGVTAFDLCFCRFLDLLTELCIDFPEHYCDQCQLVLIFSLGAEREGHITVDFIPDPFFFRVAHMSSHVIHKSVLGSLLRAHDLPQRGGLFKVLIRYL